MTAPKLATLRASCLRLLAPLALVAIGSGCSQQVSSPRAPLGGVDRDPAAMEVFEDAEPGHAYVEAGDLWARTLSKPATIERLRKEAAKFYMDGIYAVECRGPLFGECTAKGFVYEGSQTGSLASDAAVERASIAAR